MKRPVAVACLLVWIACGCYRADVEEPDGGRDAGVADAGVVDAGEPWMPSACMAPPTCRWRARADGTCAEVVEIASGLGYACVLLDDGHVECAGRDVGEDGVLGRGEVVIEDWEPRPVVGIDDAIDLDSDGVRVCVLRASGSVVCWGNDPNRRGEAFPTPEEVARIPGAVRLAMTYVFGCVLTERREVWCWRGYGAPTVLGVGLSLDATETGPVRVLDDATGVWAAQRMACAASESAGLVCWGSDAGLLFYEPSPVRLFGSLETVHAGVGFAVVCVAAGARPRPAASAGRVRVLRLVRIGQGACPRRLLRIGQLRLRVRTGGGLLVLRVVVELFGGVVRRRALFALLKHRFVGFHGNLHDVTMIWGQRSPQCSVAASPCPTAGPRRDGAFVCPRGRL